MLAGLRLEDVARLPLAEALALEASCIELPQVAAWVTRARGETSPKGIPVGDFLTQLHGGAFNA